MLIFDVVDDRVTLSNELVGDTLLRQPSSYIYLMNYIDLKNLVHKASRLLHGNATIDPDNREPIDMIAASWVANVDDCQSVLCPIMESSYTVVYFTEKSETQERIMDVATSMLKLAGRLLWLN